MTIATAIQMAHPIPSITDFQTKRDTSEKKYNIAVKGDGIYMSYTRQCIFTQSNPGHPLLQQSH